MGTTLRTVVEDIGGGVPGGKKFKAAQTGGPSGGCIPASLIDTPIDYESLSAIGSMMGSGGLIVMDEDNCMVDIAKFYPGVHCGRVLRQVLPLPHRHQAAAGSADQDHRGQRRAGGSGHHRGAVPPHQAVRPVRPGPDRPQPRALHPHPFPGRVRGPHRTRSAAPPGCARRCIQYIVDPTKCKGCTRCAQGCPTGAISGAVRAPHIINQSKCIKCGACMDQLPL